MVSEKELQSLGGFGIVLALISLAIFLVLKWVGVAAGSLLDWVIGLASFWWLLVIVTVPWNVHFTAKKALATARQSRELKLEIKSDRLAYVQKIAKRSLIVAIALHIGSAITFYILVLTGVSTIGYFTSVAALLLTGLRPAIVFYSYLASQIQAIEKEFKYPRDDVLKLLAEVAELKSIIEALKERAKAVENQLDGDRDTSLVARQNRRVTVLASELQTLSADHRQLASKQQADCAELRSEARDAIAQITADGQFLENVRDIIRFIKSA
ncbi:MAG: hypothetical protein AAF685_10085 [Cyanobacteria bacterium P01_C01_bin.89]